MTMPYCTVEYELEIIYPCRYPTVHEDVQLLTLLESSKDQKVYDFYQKVGPGAVISIDMSAYHSEPEYAFND